MAFNLSSTGKLSFSQAYLPQSSSISAQQFERHDPVGIHSLYMNSEHNVEAGHLIVLSETQLQTSIDNMHTIREANVDDKPLGVVMETAATPTDISYTNKNGKQQSHFIKDHSHVLRVARPGSIVNAWVVNSHENKFDGIYNKTVNGTPDGLAVVTEIDNEHFVIKPMTAQINNSDVQFLKDRLDALTL